MFDTSQQQIQKNNIASSDPPLVTIAAARKSLPLCLNRLWSNLTSGTPSHSCPFWQPSCASRRSAPDGPKRLGTAPTHKAAGRAFFCDLWPASIAAHPHLNRTTPPGHPGMFPRCAPPVFLWRRGCRGGRGAWPAICLHRRRGIVHRPRR